MKTIGQLSGGVAHDFNNLLTVIIGNAETMGTILPAQSDLKEMCDTILSAAEQGAELTRRLLALGRKQALKPAVIECNQLVENAQTLLRHTLREDIEIHISQEQAQSFAYVDPTQLESAILNLALNAQDAMPQGGRLTIATTEVVLNEHCRDDHPEVQPGQYLLLAVTDDGVGMPPEVRERVFEPFFTTKEVGKGSGLGLSMVYGFVKQSNGHVVIYSQVGLGTTVRLYFPTVSDCTGEALKGPQAVTPDLPRGHGTILLVEDDPPVREYAVKCLESLGYRVITAVDGRDALIQLGHGMHPDLLFTDVVMPGGVTGWELAQRAQELRPTLKILLTSGYSSETLAAHGHHAGVCMLAKPYRKWDLAWALHACFTGRPHNHGVAGRVSCAYQRTRHWG